MKAGAKLTAATAILMSLGGVALAAGDHGHDSQGASGAQGPRAGNHDMMQMHAQMMGGGGPAGGMVMMGTIMERLDTNGDGTVTSQEANEGLQALLAEYDADGDEDLSLAEFETLHSALIRETMVDRFQFLDADGDGAVTAAEIVEPADMMGRMETMRNGMMPGPNVGMQGDGGMMGAPGEGRMGNN